MEGKSFILQGEKLIHSPLPGRLKKILVNKGEKIIVGQKLAYLESMKMNNEILSTCNGVVDKILIEEGSSVEENEPIFRISCR